MPPKLRLCFRYKLIAQAANPRLGPAKRGQFVRELASQPVELPDGRLHHFSRGTFDRWLRAYSEQGLAGLKPEPRADLGIARRHPELLEETCQLREKLPARSAAQLSAGALEVERVAVAVVTSRGTWSLVRLRAGRAPSYLPRSSGTGCCPGRRSRACSCPARTTPDPQLT